MELKDVVLEALAELESAQQGREQVLKRETIEEAVPEPQVREEQVSAALQPLNQVLSSDTKKEEQTLAPLSEELIKEVAVKDPIPVIEQKIKYVTDPGELRFLQNLRERILVLFEGFQSPNNVKIEAKVDLILNFLEYTLASIDERSDKIKEEA